MNSTIPTPTVGQMIRADFPSLDKNDDLARNDQEIGRKCYREDCRVERVIQVSRKEFNEITNSLLADRPNLWDKIGGATLSNEDEAKFAALCKENGADSEDWQSWGGQTHLMQWFREHCFTMVVILHCPDSDVRPIVVNTEGHLYARTVGRLA